MSRTNGKIPFLLEPLQFDGVYRADFVAAEAVKALAPVKHGNLGAFLRVLVIHAAIRGIGGSGAVGVLGKAEDMGRADFNTTAAGNALG